MLFIRKPKLKIIAYAYADLAWMRIGCRMGGRINIPHIGVGEDGISYDLWWELKDKLWLDEFEETRRSLRTHGIPEFQTNSKWKH